MADHEATITKLRERAEAEEAEENGEVEDADFDDLVTEHEAATASSTREYIVLVNTGQAWKELGRTVASTADKAIQETLGEKLEPNVEYVGVAKRGWQPTSFEPKITTTYTKTRK